MAQWTVDSYVPSSSLARGARFPDAFVHFKNLFYLTVSIISLCLATSPLSGAHNRLQHGCIPVSP
jgi:hypothetical protein